MSGENRSQVNAPRYHDPPPMEHSMVCLSFVEDGSRVAFAAFDEGTNTIMIEERLSNGFEAVGIIERVLSFIRPNLILLANKTISNSCLLEALTTPPPDVETDANLETRAAAQRMRRIPYQLIKSSAYEVKKCMALILNVRVQNLKQRQAPAVNQHHVSYSMHMFDVSSYHALASLIDFDSVALVKALGSLLAFMESTRFGMKDGPYIEINSVRPINIGNYMVVPANTLRDLRIFATEHHPLLCAKGSGNSKEGFSLLSFLDRTKSRMGRHILKEWMSKPLMDVDMISRRQDGIELFLLTEMSGAKEEIVSILPNIGAVDHALARILKCATKPTDFVILMRSLTAAIKIVDVLQRDILWRLEQRKTEREAQDSLHGRENPNHDVENHIEYIRSIIFDCDICVLDELLEPLSRVVDETATQSCRDVVVLRPGSHPSLDELKFKYDCLEELLKVRGSQLRDHYPHLPSLKVIYMPQVGYLLSIQESDTVGEGLTKPDDFEFVFAENGMYFFKNTDTFQLDEDIGDLDSLIKDNEVMIITELEDNILKHEDHLRCAFNAIGELDCVLSLSDVAQCGDFVRPLVVPSSNRQIRIVNGRNPLQEILLGRREFKPNHTLINDNNRVNVLTGPNFSGKSCYTRQVGILVYMAQIGSFIPCEEATISVVDCILSRFSSTETCAIPQSSFQLDLTRLGSILNRATPHSLVLIDEFGKGTSPASGISLLAASLKKLSQIQCSVISSTHFLEMFSMRLLAEEEHVGCKPIRMAVLVPETSTLDPVPLFKLEPGVAMSSAGLTCAVLSGIKRSITERAGEILGAIKKRRKIIPLDGVFARYLDLAPRRSEQLLDIMESDWTTAPNETVSDFSAKSSW